MSDEDRDVDVESDEDDDDGSICLDSPTSGSQASGPYLSQVAEKRAHHNALERKRRDHIKESFHSLRDSVPALEGEKVSAAAPSVSRAQILKKAADYIQFMRRKNHSHQQDIDDLKKQNNILEQQIRSLEKAKSTGAFASQTGVNLRGGQMPFDGGSESESSDVEDKSAGSRRKKLKTAPS
ncbi:protein max-like isoform X6 [Haliotis rubra]|uniref:protein max-like isoform X5 n=1 Tax=Haliotis rubra TaxID=36100 RepID=UPI001EE61056|nr:protein max-like isoform X5 [Haliotis rubra]XP_046571930.1 protein max-like isoform X6 [Haliotis rubra]